MARNGKAQVLEADAPVCWEEVTTMVSGSLGTLPALQHAALRLDATHVIGRWTQLLQNAAMIPFPQRPWRFVSPTPTGKKENQKTEHYCPGSYCEMSHPKGALFQSRKELPTNTTTSQGRLWTASWYQWWVKTQSPLWDTWLVFSAQALRMFSLTPVTSLWAMPLLVLGRWRAGFHSFI